MVVGCSALEELQSAEPRDYHEVKFRPYKLSLEYRYSIQFDRM